MTLFALAAASALVAAQDAAPAPRPLPVLSHAQLAERMMAIAGATQISIGKTRAGRDITALRIAKGDENGRPAILVVADVDGSQSWTSSLALFEAEELARRANDGDVAKLLDAATIYVVPCANPDAHEHRFATPRDEREATGSGIDDDRDGRQGEDPRSDVDGDGAITWIRVEDPRGEWTSDANDARVLVQADAKKGTHGRWKLWPEGRDLDHDERVAEDAPQDACVNRNFAADWQEHTAVAGSFPTDEPETRALCEFVILHPEIALVLTYGSYDNLVEKPKAAQGGGGRRAPSSGMLERDIDVLVELGKRYGELTGNKSKGRGGDEGTWQSWLYAHRGLWSLAVDPWDIPLDAKDERSDDDKKRLGELSDDAKRLKWIDANAEEAWRFVAWHEVQHPELGRCEVGGFAPFARSEPPAAKSREIADKELAFLLSLGSELARVQIARFTAKSLGGDVYELEALVRNDSRLAMQSASALRAQTVRPLRTRLELANGATLLAGDGIALTRELAGGGASVEYRWLVRVKSTDDVVLKIDTDHAGAAERRPEVKR